MGALHGGVLWWLLVGKMLLQQQHLCLASSSGNPERLPLGDSGEPSSWVAPCVTVTQVRDRSKATLAVADTVCLLASLVSWLDVGICSQRALQKPQAASEGSAWSLCVTVGFLGGSAGTD